jgi:hypothetical protein
MQKNLLWFVVGVLLLAPLATAQRTCTKVGDWCLGQTFEQAFPSSYQPKFLEYLKTDTYALTNVPKFVELQNGGGNLVDEWLLFHDSPDEHTTILKTLVFHKRQLVAVLYTFETDTTFDIQRAYLVGKYGKPSNVSTDTVQNGFGARWNTHTVVWHLPNGDTVSEFEHVEDSALQLCVSFKLKDGEKPTPYKSPY